MIDLCAKRPKGSHVFNTANQQYASKWLRKFYLSIFSNFCPVLPQMRPIKSKKNNWNLGRDVTKLEFGRRKQCLLCQPTAIKHSSKKSGE